MSKGLRAKRKLRFASLLLFVVFSGGSFYPYCVVELGYHRATLVAQVDDPIQHYCCDDALLTEYVLAASVASEWNFVVDLVERLEVAIFVGLAHLLAEVHTSPFVSIWLRAHAAARSSTSP